VLINLSNNKNSWLVFVRKLQSLLTSPAFFFGVICGIISAVVGYVVVLKIFPYFYKSLPLVAIVLILCFSLGYSYVSEKINNWLNKK